MSTHEIPVVRINEINPHPDSEVTGMEITKVFGWVCCIGKGQFKVGDLAVYIPPDYELKLSNPAFAFLKKPGKDKEWERIKVKRLRGQLSQGLLIPVPPEVSLELGGVEDGDNLMTTLGIRRYEPPEPRSTYGNFVSAPSGLYLPKFDVESYQRYASLLVPGEQVVITEKLHGSNGRMVYARNANTGEMEQFCGSRTNWMGEDEKNIWWVAYRQNPSIGEWCRANPEKVVYGEVFGSNVQDMLYSAKANQVFFAAFAILDGQTWVDRDEFDRSTSAVGLPIAPVLYRGPFDEAKLFELAEGDSKWPGANHLAEGAVVTPVLERVDPSIGRVCLKAVSNRYLER